MHLFLIFLAFIGSQYLLAIPIRRFVDTQRRRDYEKLRSWVLNRESMGWRRKVHLLNAEDQKLSAQLEQQEVRSFDVPPAFVKEMKRGLRQAWARHRENTEQERKHWRNVFLVGLGLVLLTIVVPLTMALLVRSGIQ